MNDTSSETRDAWLALVQEAKSKLDDPVSVAPEEMARAPNNGVHACSVMCTAMRSALKEEMNARMGAVQEELSQLKPLKRMAKAVEREFRKDNINDAPHANPTSMSAQVPAQVAAATITPSSKPTANKSLPQIDRVPTATNVPSFIERYEVDMLNVAGVKARFGLNNLDSGGNKQLTSKVTVQAAIRNASTFD